MVNTVEERIKELDIIINRIDKILSGLETSESFNLLLDDFRNQIKNIDCNWQFIEDPLKLQSMKIMKLATLSVVNIMEVYRNDLKNAKIEKAKIENPDTFINKDYDSQ